MFVTIDEVPQKCIGAALLIDVKKSSAICGSAFGDWRILERYI